MSRFDGGLAELDVYGEDAVAYLQGQLSQDLLTPRDDDSFSLILSPTGEVVSWAFIEAGDFVRLSFPYWMHDAVIPRLKRFVLRSRVAFSEVRQVPLSADAEQRFSQLPWSQELRASLPPHSFGAEFVRRSVSFAKGCFTGQELVGRADARSATMPWRYAEGFCDDLAPIERFLQSHGPQGPQRVYRTEPQSDGGYWFSAIAHRSAREGQLPKGATFTFFA